MADAAQSSDVQDAPVTTAEAPAPVASTPDAAQPPAADAQSAPVNQKLPTFDELLAKNDNAPSANGAPKQLPTFDELLNQPEKPVDHMADAERNVIKAVGTVMFGWGAFGSFGKAGQLSTGVVPVADKAANTMKAFGTDFSVTMNAPDEHGDTSFLSKDTQNWFREAGIWNDYKGQDMMSRTILENLMRPAAYALSADLRVMSAGFHATQVAVVEAGSQVGLPTLGKDAAISMEGLAGQFPLGFHTGLGTYEVTVPPVVQRGMATHALSSEAVYSGVAEPSLKEEIDAHAATPSPVAAAAYEKAKALVPETAGPPTLDTLARQQSPEIYEAGKVTDAIKEASDKQTLLTWRIEHLKEETKPHSDEDLAAKQAQIDNPNNSNRQVKKFQQQLEDMHDENAEHIANGTSPEIEAARKEIEDLYTKKQDLQTSASRRAARSKAEEAAGDTPFTQEDHNISDAEWSKLQEAGKVQTDENGKEFVRAKDYWDEKTNRAKAFEEKAATEQTPPLDVKGYVDDYIAGRGRDSLEHQQFAANNADAIEKEFQSRQKQAPSGKSPEEQHADIAADISKKAQAAGIDKEQAEAGAVLQAKGIYGFFGRMFGVSAEEMYAKHGAEFSKVDKQYASKKGSYNPITKLISIMRGGDVSTMMHEGAHHFLVLMDKFSKMPDAPKALLDEMGTVRSWLRLKDGADLADIKATKRAHEQFARGFEQYMREGKAPSKELAPIFAKMKQWFGGIYEGVKNIKYQGEGGRYKFKLTDEARAFFDRTLSENPKPHIEDNGHMPASPWTHKVEAENVSAKDAPEVADKIADDIIKTAETDKDIANAIESTKPSTSAETPANIPAASTATGPAPRQADAVKGADTVSGSGDKTATESGRRGATPRTSERNAKDDNGEQPAGPWSKLPETRSSKLDKAGNIRLDNIPSPAALEEALQLHRDHAAANGDYLGERRGVVSDRMVLDIADSYGVDPAFINRKEWGDAYSASEIKWVQKQIGQSHVAVVEAMLKAEESGADEDLLKLAEVLAKDKMVKDTFMGKYAAATAESGRAQRALRKTQEFWGGAEARDVAALDALFQEAVGKDLEQLKQMAKYGSKLKNGAQLAKFLETSKLSKFNDFIRWYYVNCLLSGPITHARYAAGNAIMSLWTPLVRTPVAASVGAVLGGADRVYFGEVMESLYSMGKGSRDGWKAAVESYQSGIMPRRNSTASEPFANMENVSAKLPVPGIAGQIIGAPIKSVTAIHSFFYTLRYEQSIAAQAYRSAKEVGAEGEAFNLHVAKMSQSPTEAMMDLADKDSLKELYMQPSEYDSFKAKIARAADSNLASKAIVPFAKVGLNITSNAFMDQQLLGLFSKEIRDNVTGKNGAAARDMQIAKIGTGTALGAMTALAVTEGVMTGDGPSNPDQRRVWLLTHTPRSIQIGGSTFSYGRFGSLSSIMAAYANMAETAGEWDQDTGDQLAASALHGVVKSVFDETFMLGVKNAMDAIYDPDEYGARYIQSLATNLLPYSVGQTQLDRMSDPYQREVRSHGLENFYGIIDEAKARMPWTSESLNAKYDVFGNPIMNNTKYDVYKNDPVVMKLDELHMGIGNLKCTIVGVKLTDEQYANYAQLAGKMVKQSLDGLVSLDGFNSLPKGVQMEAIHRLIGQQREAAASVMKAEYPQIIWDAAANKAAIFK